MSICLKLFFPIYALIILIVFAIVPIPSCPKNSVYLAKNNCIFENDTITNPIVTEDNLYNCMIVAYLTIIPLVFIIFIIIHHIYITSSSKRVENVENVENV
jgi:hypothetical protein